jgi:hypothetical protein
MASFKSNRRLLERSDWCMAAEQNPWNLLSCGKRSGKVVLK